MTRTLEERNANLAAARALIAAGWCRGSYAEDEAGQALGSEQINDETARASPPVCYCARGALVRVLNLPDDRNSGHTPESAAISTVARRYWRDSEITVNDEAQSVAEVLTLFDLAMQEPL